jgi:hypothetical protein
MAGPPPPTIVYAQVMPGYIMRPPRVPPQPGMVVVGYESKFRITDVVIYMMTEKRTKYSGKKICHRQ